MNKYTLLLVFQVLSLFVFSQDDKTVTLVVSGQGKTQDEARQNALRGAIEQAFGTFISSKTEILNDNLIKDEIVSIANGNIQKFDIVNETLLPNNMYVSTLNTTVSIGKLTTFCQSKGITSEFKGGLFAMNIALQELNEKNELKALDDLYKLMIQIIPQCVDYKIVSTDPVLENNEWTIPINIEYSFNQNYKILVDQVYRFAKSISLGKAEIESYIKLNKNIYRIKFDAPNDTSTYHFRNKNTVDRILSIPYTFFKFCISNTNYDNGLEKLNYFDVIDKFGSVELESKYVMCELIHPSEKSNNDELNLFFDKRWISGFKTRSKIKKNNDGKYQISLADPRYPSLIDKNWFRNDFSEPTMNVNFYDWLIEMKLFNIQNTVKVFFKEKRNLEEIKKITEYKVVINQ